VCISWTNKGLKNTNPGCVTSQRDQELTVVHVSCCLHNLQSNDTDTSKDFLISAQDTVDWKTDNLIAFFWFINLRAVSNFNVCTHCKYAEGPVVTRRLNSIQPSRATSRVRSLKGQYPAFRESSVFSLSVPW